MSEPAPHMRVDVVAAPLRYRRGPIVVLLLLAILPALGLVLLHDWLDGEADAYDATRDDVAEVVPGSGDAGNRASAREIGQAENRAALTTPLLDYRRLPAAVSGTANIERLKLQVDQVFQFIDDSSCAAVSVGGVAVGAKNADLPVVPASTTKLITAAVALEVLGEDHVFETTVRAPAVVDGVVDGDVYLVGGGDPLLTSTDFPLGFDALPAFNTTPLDELADAVALAGVKRIKGTVLGDGSRYDDEFVVEGWGDGVAFNDAGPYDALLVNDSRVVGRNGRQPDPNEAAAREFVRLLEDRGVRVNNGSGSGTATEDTTVVATVTSSPLAAVVEEMLTTSDNNTAEMLVKELGFADTGLGTRPAGIAVIDRTLAMWEIPVDGVRLFDGSGLSPRNRLTCQALLAVLEHSRGTSLATSLPAAGRTGTLVGEFAGSPMIDRLFAKTGTLANPPVEEDPPASKALAGYVIDSADAGDGDGDGDAGGGGDDGAGPPALDFVIILNAPEIDDAGYKLIWALFGERFATYPDGPPLTDLGPR